MTVPEVFRRVFDRKGWRCAGSVVEIPLEEGRKQTVHLTSFEHEDLEMIRVYSVIGDSDGLGQTRLVSALRLNFNMPHGALAIHEDRLVVTDTFLLKDADEGEIEASISYLAETADRYEKFIYRSDQH